MATTAVGGALTAASPLLLFQTQDAGLVGVEVSGTWTGTITFEVAVGTVWVNAQVFTTAGASTVNTMTANGSRQINVAGYSAVRANFSTPSSGSPAVIFVGSPESMGGGGAASAGAVAGETKTIVTVSDTYTGAQTNLAIATVSAGTVVVCTGFMVTAHNSNTVNVAFTIGFGAATVPAGAGRLGGHPGIAPGSGFGRGSGAGILGKGADGEDLRFTCTVPTGGSIEVTATYYTQPA